MEGLLGCGCHGGALRLLQVLLWTTCLLSSCAAASARPEDAGYIIRETVRPRSHGLHMDRLSEL